MPGSPPPHRTVKAAEANEKGVDDLLGLCAATETALPVRPMVTARIWWGAFEGELACHADDAGVDSGAG